MTHTSSIVVETIVEFHRLVPVVHARSIVETVIARGLGRLFEIGFRLTVIEVEIRGEALTWAIVEIILWREALSGIIVLTKILHTVRFADGVILTSHMVGHKVDDDLHASLVRALDECFELLHTLVDIDCEIGVDIIVVGDRIRRACPTLHHCGVVPGNTIGRIVGLSGMTDDTRVPDMAHAHLPDLFQDGGREVVQFATAILGQRTILLASDVTIAVKPRKNLINNSLLFHINYSIPWAETSLLILTIIPWRALPGPHSVKSSAPSAIMFCTL